MTHDVLLIVIVMVMGMVIVFGINFYAPAVQLIRERINALARSSFQHGIHVFVYDFMFNQMQLGRNGLIVSEPEIK
jgi:hypothetical protein